jgi:predicted dehydrogenase
VRSQRPIRVGIIGTGNISRNHVAGYRAAGAEIAAIADIDPVALEARRRRWRVDRAYSDYRDLVALPDIDAVSVCTPNAVHCEATVAAALAGKHVLCEKPLSLSLEDAQSMIDACRAAGVVLQVNHHLRSSPVVQRARLMIQTGELGAITFIRFRQAHDWGGAPMVPPSFRSRTVAGGGTLLDNGCHMFDLAHFLGGPVADVFCRVGTLKFEAEVEDTAAVSLRFERGALGEIETAWTATGWEEGFWIYGTKGTLEFGNRPSRPVLRHVHRGAGTTSWAQPEVTIWKPPAGSNYVRHVASFLASIRGETPVICTGEDGLEAVRLVLAAYRSAATGRPVEPNAVS